ncbi:MAG: hypothetical protein Fur0024_4350 [Patescibacteria group bacterium]
MNNILDRIGALFPNSGPIEETLPKYFELMLIVVGLLAVVYIIYGGILYITSGGDDGKAKTARKAVVNAIIGLVIVLLSFAIYRGVISIVTGTSGSVF